MDEYTNRLETFSDGVFAVAATILVLEISVARVSGDLGGALLDLAIAAFYLPSAALFAER